jgi:molecular chaperone DnaK (HSP70)
MSRPVGIDLGTTYSLVAAVDDRGGARVLPNRDGKSLTPSAVCFKQGRPVVGEEAKAELKDGTPGVAAFFKRQMGSATFTFPANGRTYSATELSALVLAQLKADAEAALGHPVTEAVITVPAYFRDPERRATREAGELAGLRVLQLVNEPTAAAIAFGQGQASGPDRTVLVYDLGGGTFDVTLLQVGADEIRVLTSDGDHELGGKDWDSRIVQFLAASFEQEHGSNPLADAVSIGELLHQAEQAKRQLSAAEAARVSIFHDGRRGSYELSRAAFEQMSRDLLDRTLALVRAVLDARGLTPAQIDGVLLVGGSTRMPMVAEALTRLCGKAPLRGIHPDEAVALGAALCAHGQTVRRNQQRLLGPVPIAEPGPGLLIGRRRTTDVTTHSLGMVAVNADNSAYVNSIILPKDQPVPCRETRPYQHRTGKAGEDYLEIFMTQGEVESPGDVVYLGRYVLHGLPASGNQALTVEVEYAYDESGTVSVSGRLRGRDGPLPLRVEPLPPDVPARFLRPPPRPRVPHVTVYLVIDVSLSMSGSPLAEAKKAAHSFLSQLDLSHTSVGVIALWDQVDVRVRASQNAKDVGRAIDGLRASGGNAAEPFAQTLKLLRGLEGPRFVITLADGVWERQDVAVANARACHKEGIETIAIGFGGADRAFLRQIASGDEAALMTSQSGLVGAFTGIAQVITQTQGGTADPPASPAAGSGPFWGLFRRRK